MVWGIAFGELLCGGLWGVFCGYVGMRTHFLSINPDRQGLLYVGTATNPLLCVDAVVIIRGVCG